MSLVVLPICFIGKRLLLGGPTGGGGNGNSTGDGPHGSAGTGGGYHVLFCASVVCVDTGGSPFAGAALPKISPVMLLATAASLFVYLF